MIMRDAIYIVLSGALVLFSSQTKAQEENPVEVSAMACEKIVDTESKSSARVRAADKASFLGVKKTGMFDQAAKVLNEHDFNVMVYTIVDEHLEDLSVQTAKDEEGKICVEIKAVLDPQNAQNVIEQFLQAHEQAAVVTGDEIKEIAQEVKTQIHLKPNNPENLALVYVKDLEYYNGSFSSKYAEPVKKVMENNPYFYLTQDQEIADYVVFPKVLKAKVDTLDAAHKRLQMVVVLEISGLDEEPVTQYQNRFVLFGAEEDSQSVARRLMRKLLEQATSDALLKIEHREQQKIEKNEIGRVLTK